MVENLLISPARNNELGFILATGISFRNQGPGHDCWPTQDVSLLLLVGAEAFAATPNEKDSLRGLQGVLVKRVDFNSQPANLTGKLVVHEIRTEVEAQLSQAGILILDEGGSPDSIELPFLQIQGAISQIAKIFLPIVFSLNFTSGQPSCKI